MHNCRLFLEDQSNLNQAQAWEKAWIYSTMIKSQFPVLNHNVKSILLNYHPIIKCTKTTPANHLKKIF